MTATNVDFQKNMAELAQITEQEANLEKERTAAAQEMQTIHEARGEEGADHDKLTADFRVAEIREQGKAEEIKLVQMRKRTLSQLTGQAALAEQAAGNMKPAMIVADGMKHLILHAVDGSEKAEDVDFATKSLQGQGYNPETPIVGAKAKFIAEMVSTRYGNDSSIDYTNAIPVETYAEFVYRLNPYGGVLDACSVQNVDRGVSTEHPVIDFTGKVATDKAEGQAAGSEELVSPTEITLAPKVIESGVIPISIQLIRDSAPAILPMAFAQVEYMKGLKINTDLTNGTGTGNKAPQGLVEGAGVNVPVQDNGTNFTPTHLPTLALSWTKLIDIEHSINASYRRVNYGGNLELGNTVMGNVGWMMSDNMLSQIKKLRDTQNRPLFLPNIIEGQRSVGNLIGYPVFINEQMQDWGQNSSGDQRKLLVFGNFGYYMARFINGGAYTEVYTDSAFAKDQNVGIQSFAEFTGAHVGGFSSGTISEAVVALTVKNGA